MLFGDWRFQDNPAPKEPAADQRAHAAATSGHRQGGGRKVEMDSGRLAPKPRGASRGVSVGPGPSRPPPPALGAPIAPLGCNKLIH